MATTAQTTNTMQAITRDAYGASEVLQLSRIARPGITESQVLVQVHASGLDRGAWHLMTGKPYLMRLGFGFRRPRNPLLGRELAGTVVEIGSAVTRFAVGDEVFGIGQGSFAEYSVAREDKLALKPGNTTFEKAAVVPVSGLTALQALRDAGRVEAGQKVLIIGASGGVGSHAVQLAKAFGAEVTAVCSTGKLDLVRSLGADHVLDYTREDVADGRYRYDVILDIGGNRRLSRLRRALTSRGRLVIVGGETGGRWLDGLDRQFRAVLLSPFISQQLGFFITSENAGDLVTLRELIESGQVTPLVDRTYPLSRTPAAVRYLQDGRARGKVVIEI
ncbi:MAG: NAD(P)-dependent alcohol dehydrogenase [Marmoricola sp.]|nr:NAD(P)-dependent alcohol dehydrogenase [Marmoricola sp.]